MNWAHVPGPGPERLMAAGAARRGSRLSTVRARRAATPLRA
jgi:hypothetical protein